MAGLIKGKVWLLAAVAIVLTAGLPALRGADAAAGPVSRQSDNLAREKQDQAIQTLFGPTEIYRDLVFAKTEKRDLKLDLFVPKAKPKPGVSRPLVVWVHGGGWRGGAKEPCATLFLLKAGYAVASIEYRLTQEASFPAQIWDCKAAIRFLRAKANDYGYDPGAIGVMGGSAGGHLVSLLGTTNNHPDLEGKLGDFVDTSSSVQAVCDLFGPTDLTVQYFDGKPFPKERVVPMPADKILNTDVNTSTPKNELTELLGGQPMKMMEKAQLASPIVQASKTSVPFLILHGTDDKVVPIYQSRTFAEKLKSFEVPVELVEISGAGHSGAQFFEPAMLNRIRVFFDKNLRKTVDSGDEQGQQKPAGAKGTFPKTYGR